MVSEPELEQVTLLVTPVEAVAVIVIRGEGLGEEAHDALQDALTVALNQLPTLFAERRASGFVTDFTADTCEEGAIVSYRRPITRPEDED